VESERQFQSDGRSAWPARIMGGGGLLVGAALVLLILFGFGSQHRYHLMFDNGGQLVSGNQVLVGGQPIGKVDDVTLTDDARADVTISVDKELREGTTAVIRATSLSGIANRYVSITPGPNDASALPDGATLSGERTTSPVDLDQLFNAFRPRTRAALQQVVRGSAAVYSGDAAQVRRTTKYLAPSLAATQHLFAELTRDSQALSQFLTKGSETLKAIAGRRDDLSALTANANQTFAAIASQNTALDRSLVAMPPALREANTTFTNLRATLDDLTPLVNETKPATRDLAPFLRKLRPVAERAVPVVTDLRRTVNRSGTANDLTDTLRDLPGASDRAGAAIPRAIQALNASQPTIEVTRPYAPELAGLLTKYGQVSSYYDANGHYARVSTAAADFFHYCATPGDPKCTGYSQGDLAPIPPAQQFDDLETGLFTRCPGGATQSIAGSNPFTDDGNLLSGGQAPNPKCDPSDVPPGP
jgi:phospholipid/cholesterol/gamma-HCH transport system substrate-binding protein